MKTFFIALFIILFVFFQACVSQKLELEFPEAMLPHVKADYIPRCAKGKILYELNCAKCHNTKVGRKEIIPDFSEEKLQGYGLRISNLKHEQNMPDSLVSEEELVLISNFLNYRKKSKH